MCSIISKHFSLHPLTENMYAAIASDQGAAIGNSGLIDLGGQIIVFDTFLTPQAAADMRKASEELFGRAPDFVINSHYHNDHIWGNQVFAEVSHILSTIRTRELIATAGKEEFDWYSQNSTQRLETIRAELQVAENEEQRNEISFWIPYYEGLVEAFPTLKVCMPDLVFDERMEIHARKDKAELFAFEGAHTESDAVLFLPQKGVIFMGDLLFVGCHPYLADGDPFQLLKALRKIEQLDVTRFVPGHGPVGRRDDLVLMIAYVESCLELAHELIQFGENVEEQMTAPKIPTQFTGWRFPKFFQLNIQFLCQRLKSSDYGKSVR